MRTGLVATIAAWGLLSAAVGLGCTGSGSGEAGDCPRTVTVDVATSPDKARMLADVADRFNASDTAQARRDDDPASTCVEVAVHTVASSEAEARLSEGWPSDPDGGSGDGGDGGVAAPVVWAPEASTWATLLDRHRAAEGQAAMAYEATPIARTPLVLAVPRPVADAVGWPDRPLRLADLLRLAQADLAAPCTGDAAPAGLRVTVEAWCADGLGPFRLGKTNPFLSSSGLGALVVQAYAGAAKTDGLEITDLDAPLVERFMRMAEAPVVHYGATPLSFLENWYRRDRAGRDDVAGPYLSAAVVEEKSVIDYNRGDPRGTLGVGETGTRPRERLVAVYPADGTIYEDNPLVVLDAPWADGDERDAARRFVAYVRSSAVQRQLPDYGFRPVEPGITAEGPLFSRSAYGVEPEPDVPELAVPDGELLDALRTGWLDQRRPARVVLAIDVSGSMGDPAALGTGAGPRKLDLAKRAVTEALDQLDADDEVGLWVFSTALSGPGTTPGAAVRELVPVAPVAGGNQRQRLRNTIGALRPRNDTALYAATGQAYRAVAESYDPDRINAVVLLTDGHNEVGSTPAENEAELQDLLTTLAGPGQRTRPVRVFTIAYGEDADAEVLQQIADATDAAHYDSTDPTRIERIFAEVVGNL